MKVAEKEESCHGGAKGSLWGKGKELSYSLVHILTSHNEMRNNKKREHWLDDKKDFQVKGMQGWIWI